MTTLFPPERRILFGLVADASMLLGSAPVSSRVAGAPSAGGVERAIASSRRGVGWGAAPSGGGGGAAHVMAAMGGDIVASVSGDCQKSEYEGGIEKIDHHQRKQKSYSDDVCLHFDSLKLV